MATTYNNLYLDLRTELRRAGDEEATQSARELVCAAAAKTREELVRDGSLYASPEVEKSARELVKRHLAGEPVAYLIGEWEFYGLPLDISPAVLIPRPDTEVLATKLIDAARGAGACRILDLCAGSGCIGLAAAAMVVGQAYMTEISDSLQRIDAKLESIASMIAGDQKAKVKNALDIARTYAALHDDYLQKPAEARQAARNEIEGRYNDVGQVIDWITEQLAGVEDGVRSAAEREKDLEPLLKEIQSYEAQFGMCLQALSALAMTRMYYDGSMDDRSALIEEQRILDKSQGFLKKRQVLAALMEMKIGGMKGAPIALPRGTQGNALKRLVSQTPRAAAKEQLLEAKVEMRTSLRSGESKLRSEAEDRKGEIERIAAASRTARTLLTDGTDCWLIDDKKD